MASRDTDGWKDGALVEDRKEGDHQNSSRDPGRFQKVGFHENALPSTLTSLWRLEVVSARQ